MIVNEEVAQFVRNLIGVLREQQPILAIEQLVRDERV
jgi:hypothetical protein